METQRRIVACPTCGVNVREDRLGTHRIRVHGISKRPLGRMIKCEICQATVREDKLIRHKERVHLKDMNSVQKYVQFNVVIPEDSFHFLQRFALGREESCQIVVSGLIEEFISFRKLNSYQ